ncbi:hypothetical protein DXV75_05765 [Alteromonas aestuariivivens]|uniref:Uncharacterized protein n=1 Tax=Alteromonas aestuariivivens TaxID=1938339 RepID=A0A3D8MB79_9ALTE|nr:hypothetical protein [Alteromonas aestuariivivens]RDV27532.1 hypothetical protein DXV75_05765 [Alteromonas aestuariivivens]
MIVQFFDPLDNLSFEMPLVAINDRLCSKLRRNFYFGGYCKIDTETVNSVERLQTLREQHKQPKPESKASPHQLSVQEQANILAALSVMQEILLSGDLPKFSRMHAISSIDVLSPAKCQALISRLARSHLSLTPQPETALEQA